MAIQTIIFDLGNVLIDWNPSYLFDKIFQDKKQKEYFFSNVATMEWHSKQDAGRAVVEATEELLQKHPDWAEPIQAFYSRWKEMFSGPIEGSVGVLKELKESGKYKLYALTNWSAELFAEALNEYPFLHWFNGRVVSGEERINKPALDIYYILLKRYDVDPKTALFIDDRKENVAAAQEVGIGGILFTSPQQLRKELMSRNVLY